VAILTAQQLASVLSVAKAIDFNTPMVATADFITTALGLTPAEQGQFLAADGSQN
jgi:hypothetical protein